MFENNENDDAITMKDDDNVDRNTGAIKVIDAFELMMKNRGDTLMKTPRRKRNSKKSTRLSDGKIGRKKF